MLRNPKQEGYVYVGFDSSRKGFKIGKTTDLDRRENEIRHMNPTFVIFAYFKVPNMHFFENWCHLKFSEKRIIGEWFDLSLEEVSDFLKSYENDYWTPEFIEKVIQVNSIK
jgi:hypothetical protein